MNYAAIYVKERPESNVISFHKFVAKINLNLLLFLINYTRCTSMNDFLPKNTLNAEEWPKVLVTVSGTNLN